jgi:hypothetical protein
VRDINHVVIYCVSLVAYLVASYFKIGDAGSNYAILAAGLGSIGVTGYRAVSAAATDSAIAKTNAAANATIVAGTPST